MVSFTRKLIRALKESFFKRYNIFAGTNTWREWLYVLQKRFFQISYEDQIVIDAYEQAFAKQCGVQYGISFGAGRMALYAILEALNIGEGDEVIIPAFTCVVVPNAILYRGAKPIYVDIEAKFFNIDVKKIEAAITSKTKALYAQHTFGLPCEVDSIKELGGKYNLPVIEDAAHALGAEYKGKPVGSLTDVAFFSTDHSKVINTHLGGMVVTGNKRLADRIYRIQQASPFLDRKSMKSLANSFLIEYLFFTPGFLGVGRLLYRLLAHFKGLFYFSDELKISKPAGYAYPCQLSSLQAHLGLSQLKNLSYNLSHRREIASFLEEELNWNNFESTQIGKCAWLRYSFLVNDRSLVEKQLSQQFDLGIWFTSVVAGRSQDFSAVHYQLGSCPVAEHVAQHIVNLPTHLRIPIEKIRETVFQNRSMLLSQIVSFN